MGVDGRGPYLVSLPVAQAFLVGWLDYQQSPVVLREVAIYGEASPTPQMGRRRMYSAVIASESGKDFSEARKRLLVKLQGPGWSWCLALFRDGVV